MIILRQYVTTLQEVVAFYTAWEAYAVPACAYVPGLPPAWCGYPWRVEQEGDAGWACMVLRSP